MRWCSAAYRNYAAGSMLGLHEPRRLLAAGNLHAMPACFRLTPEQRRACCLSSRFLPAPDGNGMVPTYPPAAVLVAAAAPLVGWNTPAMRCCTPTPSSAAACLRARSNDGTLRRGAVLGTTIIAASPLYLNYSLQMMSDVPALVWRRAHSGRWRSGAGGMGVAAGAATAWRSSSANQRLVFAPIAVASDFRARAGFC